MLQRAFLIQEPFPTGEELIQHVLPDDVEEKSPLFAPDDNHKYREKIKVLPTVVPSTQNESKNESNNKTKPLTEPSVPSAEQPKQSIFVQQKQPQQKFLNLFDDEPPVLDEPIRNERKPANLFLDSDDEEDLVASIKKPSSIFNNNVTSRPAVPFSIPQLDNVVVVDKSKNVLYGDVDNNNVPVVPKSEMKSTTKSNDFGGLFDDDEPPDDFFDIIVREQSGKVDNKKIEKPKTQTKTVNLFESDDDDDDDDDFSKIIGTTKKNDSTLPAVSLSAKANIAKQSEKISDVKSSPTIVSRSPYNSPYKSIQNTGPPKSYVSFLDGDTPSFDDEPIPPPISKSEKNLFDELPPTATRTTPSKIIYDDIAETRREHSATPAISSSVGLFDETIVQPVALPRKSQSDNTTTTTTTAAKKETEPDEVGRTEDETDQSLSFKKNLSIFSNPEVTKLPTNDKENKPKPNKLKTNFNINVAALLPGAKLPSQKQLAKQDPVDEPEAEKIEKVSADSPIINNVPQFSSAVSEDKSGRLACLSKNRARIQVQRKPSTRTGRQKLYTKSLIAETEDVAASIETTDSKVDTSEPAIDVASLENVYTDSEALFPQDQNTSNVVDDDEEDWLKNVDEKPSSPSKTILYEDDDWLSTKAVNTEPKPSHVMNYDWLTASSLPPEDINPPSNYSIDDDHEQDDWLSSYVTKEKSSIVTDLPNDESDWLISSQSQVQSRGAPPTIAKVAIAKEEKEEEDWLLGTTSKPEANNNVEANEDSDDWLTNSLATPTASTGGTEKLPVSDLANPTGFDGETSDAVKSNAEMKKCLQSTLFDSDDDNDVPNQSRSKYGGETSNIFESKTETKKLLNSTLFDDDDDDVDVVPPTKAPSIVETSAPDVSKQIPPKPPVFAGESSDIFASRTETKKSFKSKLFDDDDDDDDDLFTSHSKQRSTGKEISSHKIETVKATKSVSAKAAAKSLFSDDDNSDTDDLFGTSKPTKMRTDKIEIGNKVKANKPTKTGLFDDEEDDDGDDDIFSSKTQKQRVVQADAKKKSSSITKLVATIPASNDPLADLLK